jgi:multicomponent Na+:H+ antiporter subunit D
MIRADSLAAVFVLLTAFVFLVAAIYSFSEQHSRLFWFLLFIWEGALIGVFLAGDLFNIFVLTEVATVAVSVLIMYNRNNRSMYDGIIYFMINIVVIQFYLLGLGYLYRLTGVMDMETAAMIIRTIDGRQLALPYALIMTFVALKCALLPLFSWLPKAHSTPGASPAVSAVLSGLHIKGGIYLFIRFQHVFEAVAVNEFFLVLGIVTAIVGVVLALSQSDIKRILAYSTIAQVGLIIAGLSTGSVYNHIGALYHIINHALFKSALFLSAGMISFAYRTRDISQIRGVLRYMPIVSAASVLAILGIIGMPFFNGSISKYFLMYDVDGLLNIFIVFINLGTITVFIKYALIFTGRPPPGLWPVKNDAWKLAPVVVLGCLCLAFGVFGGYFMAYFFDWDVRVGREGYLEKSLVFIASTAAGALIYRYLVSGRLFLKRIREADLGFRGMCAAVGLFFAMVLVAAGMFSFS